MTDLKSLRKAAGLSQREAGKLVSMTEGSWSQAEAGRFNVDAAKIELFEIKTRSLISDRKELGL